MKFLPAKRLFTELLFPSREPGQSAAGWPIAGSNGKGNHVDTPFAKPPPVVLWKVSQISPAKERSRPRAHAQYGVARVAAVDVGYAAAELLIRARREREATVENVRVRGPMVDRHAEQSRH